MPQFEILLPLRDAGDRPYLHHGFCRIHKTLRVTPAMAAGVTDRLWGIADIVSIIEAAEPAPAKRGSYKKQAA